jgi:hypothetical protein
VFLKASITRNVLSEKQYGFKSDFMFLRADSLEIEYGIDHQIAKFYVDREPPKDNLYWKDKLLYLRPQPGYIFLPLITDLFYKSGVDRDELLSECFVSTIEKICDYAAQEEFGILTHLEAVSRCVEFAISLSTNSKYLNKLVEYFDQSNNELTSIRIPFRALHRADLFLFSLSVLKVGFEKQVGLTQTWFALISTLLLLDDAEDYLDDKENGEQNVFIESGSNRDGFERIREMLSENLEHIEKINSSMADALAKKLLGIADKPGIKEYLNE